MTAIDSALIETLLNMSESDTLDFKRDQYPFSGATDEQKSELVKDVVAFANAWKTTDTYIVIGADEDPGGRALVVGVVGHLDDADVQQLVNAKTNRPVHFEYVPVTIDGLPLGILRVKAEQQRPIYVAKSFGKLKPNVVYVRRGSSTAEALPDEIARMGASNLRRRTLEASLKHEVVRNLQRLVGSHPDELSVDVDGVGALVVRRSLRQSNDITGTTVLTRGQITRLMGGLSLFPIAPLETTLLDAAIRSGEFVEYEASAHRIRVGSLQALLISLRGAIGHLERDSGDEERRRFDSKYGLTAPERLIQRVRRWRRSGDDRHQGVTVSNFDLFPILAAYDMYEHTARVLVATYRVLSGGVAPELSPPETYGIPLQPGRSFERTEEWLANSTRFG